MDGDSLVCKLWSALGDCPNRVSCPFRHPPVSAAALAGSSPAAPRPLSRRNPRRSESAKSALRASAFCRFLVETFGVDCLRQGPGVLDVAGGRGEVACELLNLHAIPATVLEPRLLEPRQRIDRQVTGAAAAGAVGRALPPDHLRLVVTPALTACLTAGSPLAAAPSPAGAPPMPAEWPAMFLEARQQALHRRWASPGGSHEPRFRAQQPAQGGQQPGSAGSPSTPSGPAAALAPARVATPPPVDRPAPRQAMAWSIPLDSDTDEEGPHALALPGAQAAGGRQHGQAVLEISDPVAAWRRLTECSAVVGMHPDQATDFIVEAAVAFNKPFAVVPCCVYADSQAPRLLPCGRRLATYNDLLQYLVAKDPERIRVATLPFKGRNKVLYRTPE